MPKLNITLTPQQDAFIKEVLETGEFRAESSAAPVGNPVHVIFLGAFARLG